MMRRAIAGGAPRALGLSRRLLCAEGSAARPSVLPSVTATPTVGSEDGDAAPDAKLPGASQLFDHVTTPPVHAESAATPAEAGVEAEGAAETAPEATASGAAETAPEATASGADEAIDFSPGGSAEGAIEGEAATRDCGADAEHQARRSRLHQRFVPGDLTTAEDVLFSIHKLEKKAPRRAAEAFRFVLEKDDPALISKDVFWTAMPILARISWGDTIQEALVFAKKHELDIPTNVFNCALSGLMRNGKTAAVRETIEHMWTMPSRAHPDATSYNQLIGAYFYKGEIDDAYEVLNEMKNKMLYPSWATYHALIAGCIRRQAPRRAFETLLAVEQQRFKMSAMTIGQLLVMAAEADDVAAVMQLIPRFEAALPRYANELDNMANRRYAYRLKASDGSDLPGPVGPETRGAPSLEMSGILTLLHAAYRASHPELAETALKMFDRWYPDSAIPSSAWYCLMGAYANSKNFSAAFDVLSRMRRRGEEPRLRGLHEALVKSLAADINVVDEQYYRLVDFVRPAEGEARRAALTVEESVTAGEADVPQAEPGSESVAASDEVSEASEESPGETSAEALSVKDADGASVPVEGKASFVGVTELPEERTVEIAEFNAIIAACSSVGDLDRAFHTYDEAQRLGLTRNTDTFNALIAGCITDGHFVGGIRVAEEMKECGVPFESDTINLLVRLCVRCGKFVEAQRWLSYGREIDVPVTSPALQTLARKLMQLGRLADLRSVLAIGEQAGVSSTAVLARIERRFLQDLPALKGNEPLLKRDPDQLRRTFAPDRNGGRDRKFAGDATNEASGPG